MKIGDFNFFGVAPSQRPQVFFAFFSGLGFPTVPTIQATWNSYQTQTGISQTKAWYTPDN